MTMHHVKYHDLPPQAVKGELDKCEEYWLLKLQEEQDYYEEERRLYDDNFSKLQAKICEYEAEAKDASDASKHRLTPIDEAVVFEHQVRECAVPSHVCEG